MNITKAGYNKHKVHIAQWADGAEIEYLARTSIWYGTSSPAWCVDVEYRIKPKPLEVWVLLDREGRVSRGAYSTKDEAERVADANIYYKYPHLMREVC